MNQRFNAPRPHYRCVICLWRLGLGYDRIGRLLHVRKKVAYRISKRQPHDPMRPKYKPKRWILKSLLPAVDLHKVKEQKANAVLIRLTNKKRKTYLRTKIWKWFKHGLNPKSVPRLMGCSRASFQQHIASKFKPGMTFENYAQVWQLDHIMPCSKFDLSRDDHRKLCFHFTNYQPMFCRDNKKKAAQVITHQPELIFHT